MAVSKKTAYKRIVQLEKSMESLDGVILFSNIDDLTDAEAEEINSNSEDEVDSEDEEDIV